MFALFVGFIIAQRLIELVLARRNEIWMKNKGGIEVGQSHYRYMVMIHVFFFISFIVEVLLFKKSPSPLWPFLLLLFIATQIGRVWVILTLGRYWNTKIILLPQGNVVKKGPYRFLKHPNYFIVSMELIIVPFMFQAYITAIVFTLLNIWILSIRIPAEEHALMEGTDYRGKFQDQKRFIPTISKKV